MVYANVVIKIAREQALFSLYSLGSGVGAVEVKIAFLFIFSHYYTLYSLSDFSLAESPQ